MTQRKPPPTRRKKAAPTSARPAPPEPATRDEPADPAEDPVEERAEPVEGALVPVVGVGASAGGLEAFTQLLQALPADTGMAFVLVQHLAPSHASALAEILSRATTMPVTEVEDEPTVEPNHVYVIPPGQSMVISGGTLNLLPREGRGAHHPVDMFFRALAEDRRHRAIAVVLSGTATDGTIGLAAIKAEGGITFAQDGSAQHQGMPRSAIASGCVDFVLPPNEIAREIVRIGRHPYSVPETQAAAPGGEPDLNPVIRELRRATGVDFTHYKFNTLNRRVTRRMLLRKVETLEDYVGLLQRNPEEVEALYHDVLINVTSFFRNPEAFETLKQTVLPRLIKDRSRSDPVRFWTLGCSTGQEAYSLAMAFAESADAAGSEAPLQVFATDLDEKSVETARLGVYSRDIAQDVSPERLRRFFVEVDGRYRINKSIRDVCVFSRHNALADPPFSRMDLISCRNLLIYLEPVLQQRIVPTLHYALKPAGFLWLGGSETIGGYRNLFEAADVKHKFYVKKPSATGAHFPLQHGGAPREVFTPIMARPTGPGKDLYREADRLLLSKFAPPGVLVSADLDILQYRGDTGPYLAPAPGKASLNLLKMLREGLLVGVRAAIVRAGNEGAPTRQEGLTVESNGGHREVAVEVIPIKGDGDKGRGPKSGGFLVLFEDAAGAAGSLPVRRTSAPSSPEPLADDREVARMAQELAATREYLQSVIEQQESANEELQSANEEAQSANEELQSVNEELETSKEELQSSNEELVTVNDELNNRNLELGRLNNDLVNLIGSTQMAIVMLGPDLRIRRFTPAAEKLLNLVPADLGRPIGAVRIDFDLPDLEPLLAEVMDTVAVRERDVRDKHGHWYSLRLSPYRTVDNKIDGVVLVLVDVDAMKRANEYTASIVATVREPLVVLDADQRVRTANEAFYRTFDVKPEETEGRGMFELGNGQWNIPELRRLLEQVLPHDKEFNDFVVEQEFDHIGKRTMLLNARRLLQPGDLSPSILIGIKDVTGRGASEAAIRRLAAIVSSSEDAIISKDLDGVITTWNRGAELLFGYSPEEAIGKSVTLLIPDDHVDEEPKILERIRRGEVIGHYETVRRRKDGSLVDVSLTVSPMRDAVGAVVGASKIARDITDRKRLESELRQHAIDLSEADRRKNEFLAMLAHELRNPLAPLRNALTVIRLNGEDRQAVQSAAEMMERQVDQMVRLVDDLVDVSRVSRGKIELRRGRVELASVVHHAASASRPMFEAMDQELTVTLPKLPLYLNADPTRLAQVVGNLLNNASKFSERGGRIWLSAERENGQAVIRVRDNGVGIAAQDLHRIFDIFTQVDATLERSASGLGLGLTLVKNLVELHGGTVEISSAGPGQGSEFVVSLPIPDEAPKAPPEPTAGERAPGIARRVLVVDDSRDSADSLGMLLELDGHDVRKAYDGLEAVEAAEAFRPDVILLDIGLPKLNGYEAARKIREQPWGRDMMLVALTGWGQDEDRKKSRNAGFDRHVVKPLDHTALTELIASLSSVSAPD